MFLSCFCVIWTANTTLSERLQRGRHCKVCLLSDVNQPAVTVFNHLKRRRRRRKNLLGCCCRLRLKYPRRRRKAVAVLPLDPACSHDAVTSSSPAGKWFGCRFYSKSFRLKPVWTSSSNVFWLSCFQFIPSERSSLLWPESEWFHIQRSTVGGQNYQGPHSKGSFERTFLHKQHQPNPKRVGQQVQQVKQVKKDTNQHQKGQKTSKWTTETQIKFIKERQNNSKRVRNDYKANYELYSNSKLPHKK